VVLLLCSGNENIHLLTSQSRQVLRVELVDWDGYKRYAEYDNFVVGNEGTKYKLLFLGKYSGDAGE